MKIFKSAFLYFVVLCVLPAMTYSAQVYSAQANKDALAKAQFMLRQMNAELNQLRASKQKLLAEKSQLEKDSARLQKKYDKLTRKSANNKTAFKGKFSDLTHTYNDEILAHAETQKQLTQLKSEKENITEIANQQIQKIELCVANNKKLFDINQNLLVKFEDKGVWDSMVQAEPFSKLTQVEIENLVDDYQYNMDNLRVKADM